MFECWCLSVGVRVGWCSSVGVRVLVFECGVRVLVFECWCSSVGVPVLIFALEHHVLLITVRLPSAVAQPFTVQHLDGVIACMM